MTLACAVGCGGSKGSSSSPVSPSTPAATEPTYDINARGVPQFVSQRYIGLAGFGRLSRYRSAAGHSYTDSTEPCRSMKHYLEPRATARPDDLVIYSPVNGTVRSLDAESSGFGWQLGLEPTDQPAFRIIIFHLTPGIPLATSTTVRAGQTLGTHYGLQTNSDIAVRVNTPQGQRLVSWFEVMTEDLFAEYRTAGVATRESAIISRAERDADPLTCSGETFVTTGTLPTWIVLR